MNVTELCPICQNNQTCPCRGELIRLFDLLNSVSQRVLSNKASSICSKIEPCAVGIDKLNGYFTRSICAAELISAATLNNYDLKRVYLKDRAEYLVVKSSQNQIHLKLDISKSYITGFIANPNHFSSWCDFSEFFTNTTSITNLTEARISRLDLNIDYPIQFKEFIKNLDVTKKRASLTFVDEAGERTGLIIGKGNETITVYDKTKQASLESSVTRMEIRLKQNMLPSRTLDGLPEAIINKIFFENLKLIELLYHPPLLQEHSLKQERFKSNCDRDGYFLARKLENQKRNFDRDFKHLITVSQNTTQPTEHFKRHIGDYFNSNKGENICLKKTNDQSQVHEMDKKAEFAHKKAKLSPVKIQ